jgi:choline dehydrogenase-like flavoprotein
MVEVSSHLGGFLPGAEPKYLVPGSALHICGTYRAGTSKADSVVDKYLRVWGQDDLYLGGCGVIPTQEACNPTLTAACFAIYAAEHMVGAVKSGSEAWSKL